MPRHGKKHRAALKKVDRAQIYTVEDAIKLVVESKHSKFDESVDAAIRLGVEAKDSEQMVRGSVDLPHGTGKKVRVIAFCKGEKEAEAREAGADAVGAEDLVQKISDGWLEFDAAVATPDVMGVISKVARILGPRGLMPNPKVGTVTPNVGAAVKAIKAGKVSFRIEKAGIVHALIGRVSFGPDKLKENLHALVDSVVRSKPSTSKGRYLRSLSVSSTMGPGVKVDVGSVDPNFSI